MTTPLRAAVSHAKGAVHVQSVLLDAEGPLLVVLRDAVDCLWLALGADRSNDGDSYFCVPVSAARLAQFRHGEEDLRTMFVSPEDSRLARLFVPSSSALDEMFVLTPLPSPPEGWLPDPGFYLTTFTRPVSREYRVLSDTANTLNRPIVYLTLDPPESKVSPKIDASRLGVALTLFQNGVHQAHALVTRGLSADERKARLSFESYGFEVFGFAPGSFEVHLQAKSMGDLFGYSPHVHALAKLDEIVSVVDNTTEAVKVMQENRGHFVLAVRDLMQFVARNETPLTYSWVQPQSPRVHQFTVRPASAQALYEALVEKQELSEQEVTRIGVLVGFDLKRSSWRLETAEGEQLKGIATNESGISLQGLVSGATYKVRCRDVLVEVVGTGRQSSRLELLDPPEKIAEPKKEGTSPG